MVKVEKNIVIIPAYNEEKYIGEVVEKAKKIVTTVLVIDDCSTDRTAIIAQKSGATVLRKKINFGNSEAIKYGIKFSIMNGYDIIITLDGDLAHNPSEIKDLIELYKKTNADLIIGNRFHEDKNNIPSSKIYANIFVKFFMNKLLNSDLPDVASGFRLITLKFAEKIIMENVSKGFMFVYDQIIFAYDNKFKIQYCPITVNYDAAELLTTQRQEFISVLYGFKEYKNVGQECVELLDSMITDIKFFHPFSIKINKILYCIHPIIQSDGYLFQKQSNCFKNNFCGNLYDFDNV